MKSNYLIFLLIIGVILFRSNILNLVNNMTNHLFVNDYRFEIELLQNQNIKLNNELTELLDFKNNIRIRHDYIITNGVRTNYGFGGLIINGTNYEIGDEVVSIDGLVGIVSRIKKTTSEVTLLHSSNIIVRINDENGKIDGQDEVGNLIISEISNYNNIRLNDRVYSMMGSYIGRVVRIRYGIIDNYLIVERENSRDLNFLAVLRR